jgi:hypothetical protein
MRRSDGGQQLALVPIEGASPEPAAATVRHPKVHEHASGASADIAQTKRTDD